jgi:hypothetical protein
MLAVSYYPLRHACEVKPYAFDLLASLLLLTPAAVWLRDPGGRGPLVLLTLLAPLALASSYPAAFTAGAVSLALLPSVWRKRGGATWALFLAYNFLIAGTFLGLFALVGRHQHAGMVDGSSGYWDATFPPSRLAAWPGWLLDTHAGNMFAYPAGGARGGSAVTLALFLAGVVALARRRRYAVLTLLLGPFALNLLAALPGKYPYGGSARVAQHLAPSICLLTALGLTSTTRLLFESSCARRRVFLGASSLLVLAAALSIARDVRKPFKTAGDQQARQLVRDLDALAGSDRIVVWRAPPRLYPSLEWYLLRLGERVVWADDLADADWVLQFVTAADADPEQAGAGFERHAFIGLDLGREADATCGCVVWRRQKRCPRGG